MSQAYQSTFDGMYAEWELHAHDKKQQEKDYCTQCRYAVGDDPVFCGVGGFLTGPFCDESCFWAWMNDENKGESA